MLMLVPYSMHLPLDERDTLEAAVVEAVETGGSGHLQRVDRGSAATGAVADSKLRRTPDRNRFPPTAGQDFGRGGNNGNDGTTT